MSEAVTTTSYVLQFGERGSGDLIDLSVRGTPEEAFGRLDAYRASWQHLRAGMRPGRDAPQDDPPGLRVVRRVVTDTVIADPRPAPDAEDAEEVA
jgi:hypothetical protein